jgi:hypothetical protein
MKRWLPLCALSAALACALSLVPNPSFAQSGVNLSWDDCGAAGTDTKSFACNSNTLSGAVMYATVVVAAQEDSVVGFEGVVDIITTEDPLPDWWRFLGGTNCRSGMSGSGDFTGGAPAGCANFMFGVATAGTPAFQYPTTSPKIIFDGNQNRAERVKFPGAVGSADAATLDAGLEYATFRLTLLGSKTVGTGACAGCSFHACIMLNQINIAIRGRSDVDYVRLTGAPPSGRDRVTWQGANADCSLVPARNTTWGNIKTLYR